MAEGGLEIEMSSAGLSSSGGDAKQMDATLELQMEGGHELELAEASGVPQPEGEGSIVTEPVLGIRMLMSSRVRTRPGAQPASQSAYLPIFLPPPCSTRSTHFLLLCTGHVTLGLGRGGWEVLGSRLLTGLLCNFYPFTCSGTSHFYPIFTL